MAYSSCSGRLPLEAASKLGHLPLMDDPFISELVEGYRVPSGLAPYPSLYPLCWRPFSPGGSVIETVVTSDGSFAVTPQDSSLVYIRVGIQKLPVRSEPAPLHPFEVYDTLLHNSDCIHTVLPMSIPCRTQREFSQIVRSAIFRTFQTRAILLDTLRWLFAEGWQGRGQKLPPICCPHCGEKIYLDDADERTCSCGEHIYLTDLLDWDKDLAFEAHDAQSAQLAARCMLILEFLMLLSYIRQAWESSPEVLPKTLFLHDGPLSIGGRYARMIPPMRRFFAYAAASGHPVCLCGVEKTGRFVNHLLSLDLCSPEEGLRYSVPTHGYIQHDIDGRPLTAEHHYGERILLGDRVFVSLPAGRRLVLSVPSAAAGNLPDRPTDSDLICLREILSILPALVTPVFDNALFPITRCNSLVSIAQKPCGKMLELLSRDLLKSEKSA